MGAIATRMLGAALLEWVRLIARPITVPRLIKFTSQASTDYAGANSNNLTADLQNIVTKYGATMPFQAEITGYQNAVQNLGTILTDFNRNKPDFDLFKNTMAQLIAGRMMSVPVATQQRIAARVGNAMRWGAAPNTVGNNFNTQIFVPLNQFGTSLMGALSFQQEVKISKEHKKLVVPISLALYINAMLN